jgi:hypothetical protein
MAHCVQDTSPRFSHLATFFTGMTSFLAAQTSIVLDPILPVGAVVLLGLAMAALTVAIYWRVGARLSAMQNGTLLLFRLLGIALVLALLLQPSRME